MEAPISSAECQVVCIAPSLVRQRQCSTLYAVPLILTFRSGSVSELLAHTNILPEPMGAHGTADRSFGSCCCRFWLGSHRSEERGQAAGLSPYLSSCHLRTHWRFILGCS